MPSKLAKLGRAADIAGRHDEASRFDIFGTVFGNLTQTTLEKDAVGQQIQQQPEAKPPVMASGDPSIATPMVTPDKLRMQLLEDRLLQRLLEGRRKAGL